MFLYSVFGRVISADFPVPDLAESTDQATVHVRWGSVPVSLSDSPRECMFTDVSPGKFVLRVPGIASFLVQGGREIIVDSPSKPASEKIWPFLTGPVFGALLHQLGLLPLHGSSVEVGGKAVLFLGASGSGKSTLAAVLNQRGYPALADEICAFDPNGSSCLLPSPPGLSLWEDSLTRLGISIDSLRTVRPELRKFRLPSVSKECRPCIPMRKCYVLDNRSLVPDIVIEPLQGLTKIRAVAAETYRRAIIESLGQSAANFNDVCRLFASIPLSVVRSPRGRFTAFEVADALERDFGA